MRGIWGLAAVAAAVLVLTGCAAEPTPLATPPASTAAEPAVTIDSVVDGDTIETSAGTVRIIGIDAPERGECGYDEASALVASLLRPGDAVVLQLPDGENDQDQHGRLLRYVDTVDGVDVAAAVLAAGLAVARYDSTDGYPAHPRETAYRAGQLATLTASGDVSTTACAAAAQAAAAAEQARIAAEQQAAQPPAAPSVDEWWRQYSSCTKLKKNTNGHPTGPFSRDNPPEAAVYDWFANGTGNNGDGEGDGLACE
ncbi:MAG: thermonuclease family protein [Microbacterium sp.]|uniref:thermonuclease family protein n=1 Tax=Microbacterium sp. TaxID=51671 RepID=UPI0019848DB6|nr:thermonuclease family protein [Microbacterium sp.]MBD3756775.1 thermonuclease family protein [Microbacterium sp.]